MLALLELPKTVQDRVEQGTLAPATAYEISKVEDDDLREQLAERVVAEGLSRDETIAEVRAAARRAAGQSEEKGGVTDQEEAGTTQTLKAAGCRITVENRKGLNDDLLARALREAADQIDSRRQEAA